MSCYPCKLRHEAGLPLTHLQKSILTYSSLARFRLSSPADQPTKWNLRFLNSLYKTFYLPSSVNLPPETMLPITEKSRHPKHQCSSSNAQHEASTLAFSLILSDLACKHYITTFCFQQKLLETQTVKVSCHSTLRP